MKRTHFLAVVGVLVLLSTILGVAILLENEDPQTTASINLQDPMQDNEFPGESAPEIERAPVRPESPGEEACIDEVEDSLPFPSLSAPGWRIWGKITDTDNEPLAHAEVIFKFETWSGFKDPIDPVYTNDAGYYTACIPATKEVFALTSIRQLPSTVTICGIARARRHLPDLKYLHELPYPDINDKPLRLDYVLKRGCTLHGSVVLPDGVSVTGAEVHIRVPGKDWESVARTRYDGCYAIPIDHAGRWELSAKKHGVGVAPVTSMEVHPDRDVEAPALVLSAFGSLEGIVTNPYGNPQVGLSIWALPEGSANNMRQSFPSNNSRTTISSTLDYESHNGLTSGRTTTGDDGRFRISGLSQGRYFFWFHEPYIENKTMVPLVIAETSERDVLIVLKVHKLKIFLQDESGAMIPEADFRIEDNDSIGTSGIDGGIYEDFIDPGSIQIQATTPDGLFADEKFMVHEGEYETERILVFRKGPRMGRLDLVFTGPDGRPIVRFDNLSFVLHGEMVGNNPTFECSDLEYGGAGRYSKSVPADTYWLRVTPGGSENMYLPMWENDVVVNPAENTRVDIQLRLGGRLALTFTLSGDLDKLDKPQIKIYRMGTRASFHLSSFYTSEKEETVRLSGIKPKVSYLSNRIFEPGSYRMEFREGDGNLAEAAFIIEPGRITRIEVRL